ncbi:MAG TPA: SMP-30/gluconolactonase/LRE family protein [Allosphingosinicella sp.]|nr:SMP-30/gluconolactonase/LRE family protein [Allosphingosinicella sp.]
MTNIPETVCALGAELGEGPVWNGSDRALWFVDIKGPRIHRFDPADGALRSWTAPEPVGWVLPAAAGGLVAGLKSGLHAFDPDNGAFASIARIEPDRPQNRLNDAATDPKGRIRFGTMDDSEKGPTGEYYCFDRGEVRALGLPPVRITNGPALSPDGRILYTVDTVGQVVHASDIAENGTIARTREFVRLQPGEGYPDGPTVDSEGCVWIALFFGWAARRYSPAGELLETVRFPVGNVTKLAFGGDDLRTVYATTARLHLKPEDLERQPEAGNLFAFRTDVPGIPVTPVALG